jgi:hypothetical protein
MQTNKRRRSCQPEGAIRKLPGFERQGEKRGCTGFSACATLSQGNRSALGQANALLDGNLPGVLSSPTAAKEVVYFI